MIPKKKLSDYDHWTLARSIAGYPVDPGAPVSPECWQILSELAIVNPSWRASVFSSRWPDIMPHVAKIDPHNPEHFPAQPLFVAGSQPEKLIKANDLKYLVVPEYALAEYAIYKSGFNALVGPSGAGKSFVALDISARLATAGDTTVYIAAEGLHGYSSRWEAWKAHNNRDTDQLVFYREAVNLLDAQGLSAFIGELKAIQPKMIVVDTVARCMAGGDENSTKDMGIFVESCEKLRSELSAGLLLIHHTGKDGKMRGNTALFAACDSVLFLTRLDRQITVSNSFEQGGKNKHSEEAAARHLQLVPRLVSIEGIEMSSAVLVESEMVISRPGDKLSQSQKAILEAIEAYEKGLPAAAIIDATGIGRSTMYGSLSKLRKLNYLIFTEDDKYLITELGREMLFG